MTDDPRAHGRQLRALRDRLRRLMPLNSDPEKFHVEKDGLCKELGTLANKYDPPAAKAEATTTWRPDVRR